MIPLTLAISMPLIVLVFWLLSIPVNAVLTFGVFGAALGTAIHVAFLTRHS
jgi:hypothetical protein